MSFDAAFVPYERRVREWLASQPALKAEGTVSFAGQRLYFGPDGDPQCPQFRGRELERILDYLQFVIWAEQGVVTEVCAMITANTPYRFSPDLRAGARSVQAQEGGHSVRAYQLLVLLERAEGRKAAWNLPGYGLTLDRLIQEYPDHTSLAKILFVTFVEIVDFQTASQLISEKRLAEPIRAYAIFHETEEILHRVYFRKLLEELVPQLSPAEGLFSAYAIRQLLRSFVLEAAELKQDSSETWSRVEAKCSQAIAYLRATGFFADPERMRAFEEAAA